MVSARKSLRFLNFTIFWQCSNNQNFFPEIFTKHSLAMFQQSELLPGNIYQTQPGNVPTIRTSSRKYLPNTAWQCSNNQNFFPEIFTKHSLAMFQQSELLPGHIYQTQPGNVPTIRTFSRKYLPNTAWQCSNNQNFFLEIFTKHSLAMFQQSELLPGNIYQTQPGNVPTIRTSSRKYLPNTAWQCSNNQNFFPEIFTEHSLAMFQQSELLPGNIYQTQPGNVPTIRTSSRKYLPNTAWQCSNNQNFFLEIFTKHSLAMFQQSELLPGNIYQTQPGNVPTIRTSSWKYLPNTAWQCSNNQNFFPEIFTKHSLAMFQQSELLPGNIYQTQPGNVPTSRTSSRKYLPNTAWQCSNNQNFFPEIFTKHSLAMFQQSELLPGNTYQTQPGNVPTIRTSSRKYLPNTAWQCSNNQNFFPEIFTKHSLAMFQQSELLPGNIYQTQPGNVPTIRTSSRKYLPNTAWQCSNNQNFFPEIFTKHSLAMFQQSELLPGNIYQTQPGNVPTIRTSSRKYLPNTAWQCYNNQNFFPEIFTKHSLAMFQQSELLPGNIYQTQPGNVPTIRTSSRTYLPNTAWQCSNNQNFFQEIFTKHSLAMFQQSELLPGNIYRTQPGNVPTIRTSSRKYLPNTAWQCSNNQNFFPEIFTKHSLAMFQQSELLPGNIYQTQPGNVTTIRTSSRKYLPNTAWQCSNNQNFFQEIFTKHSLAMFQQSELLPGNIYRTQPGNVPTIRTSSRKYLPDCST